MSEYYEISSNKSKERYDRYRDCSVLKDRQSEVTFLATREIQEIPVRSTDIYHKVQSNEVNRLDLLAHKYYRNPLLWWVIAQANDIYDPLAVIEPGTILRIPNIETLYGNNGILL